VIGATRTKTGFDTEPTVAACVTCCEMPNECCPGWPSTRCWRPPPGYARHPDNLR